MINCENNCIFSDVTYGFCEADDKDIPSLSVLVKLYW